MALKVLRQFFDAQVRLNRLIIIDQQDSTVLLENCRRKCNELHNRFQINSVPLR